MSSTDASTGTRLGGLVAALTGNWLGETSAKTTAPRQVQIRRASRASEQSMKLALSLRSKAGDRKVLLFAGVDAGYPSDALVTSIGHALIEAEERPVLVVVPDLNRPSSMDVELATNGLWQRESHSDSIGSDFPVREIREGLAEMRVPLGRMGIRTGPGSEFDMLLRELRERYRFILVASPSEASEADRMLLALLSDGMVLVVERDRQTRSRLQDVQRELAANLIPVLGFVLADNPARV
jgi:hypothetical protein